MLSGLSRESALKIESKFHFQKMPEYWTPISSTVIPNTFRKYLLVIIYKDVFIFEDDIPSKELNLQLKFKEHYANVDFYINKTKPNILLLSSKTSKRLFHIDFDKSKQIENVYKKLSQAFKIFSLHEIDFINIILNKYQMDCKI